MGNIDFSKIDLSCFIQPNYAKKNIDELVALCEKDSFAAYELGDRYRRKQDTNRAYKYYALADTLGHKGASLQIALLHNQQKQYKKAAQFFEKAIKQTDSIDAHVYLAKYYILGEIGGLGRNKKSFQHLLVAAKRGDSEAQFLLALSYRDGRGTCKDVNEYVFWMRCAQLNKNPKATQYINNAMSDNRYTRAWKEMIAEADKRATKHDEYFALERLTAEIMKSNI